jgi:hypothetical protein
MNEFSGGLGVDAAIISGIATVLAAGISLIVVKVRSMPSEKAKAAVRAESHSPHKLRNYSGPQNEFTELVMADNRDLRTQQIAFAKRLDDMDSKFSSLQAAMRRYLMKLAHAWGTDGGMPPPDQRDIDILADTLPRPTLRRPRR